MAIANPFSKNYDFSKTATGRALSGLGSIFSNIAKPYTGPGSLDPATGGIKQATPAVTPQAPAVLAPVAPSFSTPTTPQVKAPAVATNKTVVPPPVPVPVVTPAVGSTPQTPIASPVVSTPAGGAPATPATPATPAAPTLAETADANAEKAYQESLKISPEELSTQADIDSLIESTKKAYLNTEGKPIPMEFITGQLKAIENRATSLAEPLDAKLARLQSARTASLEASKFALDRADSKLTSERTAATKAKDDAESARRFGITEDDKKAERDQSASQFNAKMAQDESHFKITKAQEDRKIAIEEAKSAVDNSTKTDAQKAAASDALNGYSLASDILDSGKINAITGWKSPLTVLGVTNQLQVNQVKQLKGLLSLENRQKMKGQGAVSDFEGKMLSSAASSLDTNLSNEDFTRELKKVRGVFATAGGMSTPVKVIDPKTRQAKTGDLDRAGIESAVSQGYLIEYQ